MVGNAMVITLGIGEGVEHGIVKSIKAHNPNFIFFIATKRSVNTLPKIEEVLQRKLEKEKFELIVLEDENDIQECYKKSREAIRLLEEKGFARDQIYIDFTSGTKAMSSGATLASISEECETLIYVAGKRNNSTGRVITGTEKIITLTPLEIFAESKRKDVINLFNRYQFNACLEIIEDMKNRLHDREILNNFITLEKISLAYLEWDRFNHKKAMEHLQTLTKNELAKLGIDISKNKKFLGILINAKEKFHLHHIIDLLGNAKRRSKEGKYDDAVARLYRLIELIGQYQLLKHGIDTSNVDIEKVPLELKEKYERKKNEKGKIRIGLFEDYELLKALGEDLGHKFETYKELHDMLEKRNNSILAHGLASIDKNTYDKIFKYAYDFASTIIHNLEEIENDAKFPTLNS
jgi:CRISPR-associated protein (TIGR02710 family)